MGNPDDRLTRQHALVLSAEVGLSERTSIQGLIPVRTIDITGRQEISTAGVGDLEVSLRTPLTDPESIGRFSALVYYGAALPTGRDSDPEILMESVQFSRGVVAGIAGGEARLALGDRSQLYWRVETQVPVGDKDGYRFAATRTGAALFSSAAGTTEHRWIGGLEFRYVGRDEARCFDDDPRPGCAMSARAHRSFFNVSNRGGHQTRLLAGFVFGVNHGNQVGVLASYLLDADLAGDQLVSRTEITVGWQGTFGKHRHDVD